MLAFFRFISDQLAVMLERESTSNYMEHSEISGRSSRKMARQIDEPKIASSRSKYDYRSDNKLHLAVKSGDQNTVAKTLDESPESVFELDDEGNTALHLACYVGQLSMASLLLKMNPQLCLVKDRHGRTPLHTAAMKGRVDVIEELSSACPESVMQVSATNETPLHAAIRHGQEQVLKLLLDSIRERNDYDDIINKKNCGGNTLLHLAVSRKHLQIIKLLLTERPSCNAKVEVNIMNDGGFTALDILDVLPHDGKKDMEIEKILLREGALRAKDLGKMILDCSKNVNCIESQIIWDQSSHLRSNWSMKSKHNSSRDAYHALLITTAVFLAITFHAALNAPGGSLADDIKYKSNSRLEFQVGKQSSNLLRLFIWFDSIAFITSAASMIIILMHEIPLKPWMLISVFSLYGAYICSIMAISPRDALPVFLLGSPSILLASMSKHLALHTTLLELLQWLWIRVYKS